MTAPAYSQPLGVSDHEGDGPDPGLVVRAVDKHGKPITEWPKVNHWPGYDAHGLTTIMTLQSQLMEQQREYVERARTLHKGCVAGERCHLGATGNGE